METIRLHSLTVGMLAAHCYILEERASRKAFIVDPGDADQRILQLVEKCALQPVAILNTHGHADHIGGNQWLYERLGIPVWIHGSDRLKLTDPVLNLSYQWGGAVRSPEAERELAHHDILLLGQTEIKVIATPGHSAGSVCFLINNILLSGDTLFYNSVGRTDFVDGNHEQILKSIRQELFTLPDDVEVFPGHGPYTKIGQEKRGNPFFI